MQSQDDVTGKGAFLLSNPILKTRKDVVISDWREWTPPKDAKHWKAGRSAMELARAWFTSRTPQCPAEIEALLATHPFTSAIQFTEGVPEAITGLPGGGGGRNHDLLLRGESNGQRVVASIEGKADERFGNETVGSAWNKAKYPKSPKITKADKRIEKLLEMVFGPQARPNQAPWKDFRYQLLTGIAATAAEAVNYHSPGQSPVGLFIVHEFHTHLVTQQNTQANEEDYEDFVKYFYALPTSAPAPIVQSGQMYGPKVLTANRFLKAPVEIFIGKAVFDWG